MDFVAPPTHRWKLVLALVVVTLVNFVAVYAYKWWQKRKAQKEMEFLVQAQVN